MTASPLERLATMIGGAPVEAAPGEREGRENPYVHAPRAGATLATVRRTWIYCRFVANPVMSR